MRWLVSVIPATNNLGIHLDTLQQIKGAACCASACERQIVSSSGFQPRWIGATSGMED